MVHSIKNYIFKIFFIFTFIFIFCIAPCHAQPINIESVTFDNSSSFISINSYDNFDYKLEPKPVILINDEAKELYFDLQPARLNTTIKDLAVKSQEINEVKITQASKDPDIVRITIKYNEDFNPDALTLSKFNNTLFIKLKNPKMTNYYFQEVYKETGTLPLFENINIYQQLSAKKNTFNEINSAFTTTQEIETPAQNVILSQKDLLLKTKYYIDSLTIKGTTPILYGIGTYTLLRPIYLTNPNRVAFDLRNAIVNPAFRNQDIPLGNDTIKIGQFDLNTARIVINSNKTDKYTPVIYGDTQKLAILNTKTTSPLNLYTSIVDMTGVSSEKSNKTHHSMKLTFTNSLVFGFNRATDKLELLLYNVNNYFAGAIKSELRNTPFENIEINDIKSGGVKLTIPINEGDLSDVFIGADGKTLRISLKTTAEFEPAAEIKTSEIILPPIAKRNNEKHYIVIDAGHGGSDCGAIRNGINEKDITLDVSKRVEKMLEKKGYIVAMTRTGDTYVSLQDRVEYSEVFNPDIFVSIHVNSSNSETPSGLETHYYKDNSLKLAKHIHAGMLNNINAKDRGLFKSKFYVINHTTAPAVLVEMGFISNQTEREQLLTESRKNATAKAIVEGIDDYFK